MKTPADDINMSTPQAELVIAKPSEKTPSKILLYGVEGIGKSTLAAQFPKPIFIDTEGSTMKMKPQPARMPNVSGYRDVKMQLGQILNTKHDYQTLVIDSIDWLEDWVSEYLCKDVYKVETRVNIAGGYNKWVEIFEEECSRLLNYLDRLCFERGMNILLIGHDKISKTIDPATGESTRGYEVNLSEKVGPLIKQWADAVLFANYKTFVVPAEKQVKAHAIGGKERVLYCTHTAFIDAKNRFALPDVVPMTIESLKPIFE